MQDDLAHSRWAEPSTAPQTTTEDEVVLTLRPPEADQITSPLLLLVERHKSKLASSVPLLTLSGRIVRSSR